MALFSGQNAVLFIDCVGADVSPHTLRTLGENQIVAMVCSSHPMRFFRTLGILRFIENFEKLHMATSQMNR
jgi:Ni,Fe-hydrogenase maturation factor